MNVTASQDQLTGYDVIDSAGEKIGTVEDVWTDIDTDQPEFVSVKTGWLMGKTHLIPIVDANVDDANRCINVGFSKDFVNESPTTAADQELSAAEEQEIYSYFGLGRSTATSPTGLPTGGTATDATSTTGTDFSRGIGTDLPESEDTRLRLSEEELQVGKREVETGRIRLRKVVRTEHVEVPVDLKREEIHVERVPAGSTDVADDAFEDREVEVVARHEEPVIAKTARVTGEVGISKTATTDTTTVGGDVRKEDVEIERDGDVDVRDNR